METPDCRDAGIFTLSPREKERIFSLSSFKSRCPHFSNILWGMLHHGWKGDVTRQRAWLCAMTPVFGTFGTCRPLNQCWVNIYSGQSLSIRTEEDFFKQLAVWTCAAHSMGTPCLTLCCLISAQCLTFAPQLDRLDFDSEIIPPNHPLILLSSLQ